MKNTEIQKYWNWYEIDASAFSNAVIMKQTSLHFTIVYTFHKIHPKNNNTAISING